MNGSPPAGTLPFKNHRRTSPQSCTAGRVGASKPAGSQFRKGNGPTRLRTSLHLIPVWLAMAVLAPGQSAPARVVGDPALLQRALANELAAAQDMGRPMRYQLRKSSPRVTTTKDMIETRDGIVARLVAVNDQPLTQDEESREQARLNGLMADPGKQRHRKQAEYDDTARALKVLRALPHAFLYRYAGPGPDGKVQRFAFTPNPKFSPPNLETQVLTAMSGELWIDPVQARVVRLSGSVTQDVDFGWGILGRLYKGGWIVIDQAEVGGGVWRIVKFQMSMSARVVIRTRNFVTTEIESQFAPVPASLGYRDAIAMLRAGTTETAKR